MHETWPQTFDKRLLRIYHHAWIYLLLRAHLHSVSFPHTLTRMFSISVIRYTILIANASSANGAPTMTLTVSHRPRRGYTRENNHTSDERKSLSRPRKPSPEADKQRRWPRSNSSRLSPWHWRESSRSTAFARRLHLSIVGQLLSFRQPSDPDSRFYRQEIPACDATGLYWAKNRLEIFIARQSVKV